MPCPQCGGNARRELAPGFFECQTILTGQAPTGAHPSGSQGPTERVYSYQCGATYPEAAPSTGLGLCYVCGSLGAIGVCVECRRPVDGVHGQIRSNGLWCPECRERQHAEDALRAQESERQAAEAAAAELASLPTVEYLRRVAKSERSATGAELAEVLRGSSTSSYDGKGGLSLGQPTPGVDDVLLADGTYMRISRSGLRRRKVIHAASYVYRPEDVDRVLAAAREYIRAINSNNI